MPRVQGSPPPVSSPREPFPPATQGRALDPKVVAEAGVHASTRLALTGTAAAAAGKVDAEDHLHHAIPAHHIPTRPGQVFEYFFDARDRNVGILSFSPPYELRDKVLLVPLRAGLFPKSAQLREIVLTNFRDSAKRIDFAQLAKSRAVLKVWVFESDEHPCGVVVPIAAEPGTS